MQHLSDQRGVTLVELLVAMAMSTLVIFAAFAIILSALDVTTQVSGRETAMSQGRTGVETLLQQLDSGCLLNSTATNNFSPVQPSTIGLSTVSPTVTSDGSHLVFISGVGDSATPTPTLHVVQVNSSGALLDSAYAYTGTAANIATPASWQFASAPVQVLNLAQHVSMGSGSMFNYEAYSPTTDSLLNATAIAVPLTAVTAPTVAEVDLDFRFAPSANSQANQTSELQDSAVFSLTAQDNSAQNGPCQ